MIKHNLKLCSWTKLRSFDASYFLPWIRSFNVSYFLPWTKLRSFTNTIINKCYNVNWYL